MLANYYLQHTTHVISLLPYVPKELHGGEPVLNITSTGVMHAMRLREDLPRYGTHHRGQRDDSQSLRNKLKLLAGEAVYFVANGVRRDGTVVWEFSAEPLENPGARRKCGWIKDSKSNKQYAPSHLTGTKEAFSCIRLSKTGQTLYDRLTAEVYDQAGRAENAEQLEKFKNKTIQSIHQDAHEGVPPVPDRLFRTCPPDGLALEGSIKPRGSLSARDGLVSEYLGKLWNHISRNGLANSFISTSTHLPIAAWWSLLPIVEIDPRHPHLLEKKPLIWNFDEEKVRTEILPKVSGFQKQQLFCRRSREVIIDVSEIPKTAWSRVKSTWSVKNMWQSATDFCLPDLTREDPFDPHQFFRNVQVLQGSTFPVSVELRIKGKTQKFVVKRGTGKCDEDSVYGNSRFSAASCHATNEFFANCIYRHFGCPVPKAALLDVQVTLTPCSAPPTVTREYLVVFEWIDGVKWDMKLPTDLQRTRQHMPVDLLLRNFDMCGDKGQNLLVLGNDVFRIDVGGSLNFGASGLRSDKTKSGSLFSDFRKGEGARAKVAALVSAPRVKTQLDLCNVGQLVGAFPAIAQFPEWNDACGYVARTKTLILTEIDKGDANADPKKHVSDLKKKETNRIPAENFYWHILLCHKISHDEAEQKLLRATGEASSPISLEWRTSIELTSPIRIWLRLLKAIGKNEDAAMVHVWDASRSKHVLCVPKGTNKHLLKLPAKGFDAHCSTKLWKAFSGVKKADLPVCRRTDTRLTKWIAGQKFVPPTFLDFLDMAASQRGAEAKS
ncbi:hypothetical protein HDU87_001361 [Geranomyces variabilis]|uniref:Uncharacterized protein n=1 Tax=Geranomyces variabilis TaxID=109894 RepID=A0AAD5TPZ3_9FUNG|nr:hypothetical protein HDU87_001361 [Geranomyces variabilis]